MQAVAKPAYVMPKVDVGDPVLWFKAPGSEPAVAFVNGGVKGDVICLSVAEPDSTMFRVRECRHMTDPMLQYNEYAMEEGCWDHTPFYKRIAAIEKSLK